MTIDRLADAICTLQEEKERSYGVDWKRFGLVSSFFNVFRKLIRLRTVWNAGWEPTKDDMRLDTIIDLLNYLILSAVLHAELHPEAFREVHSADPVEFPSDERGFKKYVQQFVSTQVAGAESLSESVPSILTLGEQTVERWLEALANKEAQPESDPVQRLTNLHAMVLLCVEAALSHAKDAPHEWGAFIEHYG